MGSSPDTLQPPPGPPRWYAGVIWAITAVSLLAIGLMASGSARHLYGVRPSLIGAMIVACVLLMTWGRNGEWITRTSPWQWMLAVGALAFTVRAVTVLLVPYRPCADFLVYHDAGVAMAQKWTLGAQPDSEALGLRCFFPPGQVFALGVMYRLFNNSVLAAQMLNVVYGTLTVLGIWYVGMKMFGEQVGRAAALLAALLPSAIFGCMLLGAEVPETFWLVAALCLYVRAVSGRGRLAAALGCGILLGVGALIRPTYVLLGIPIGLHMLLAWKGRRRRALAAAGMLMLGVAAIVGPWTLRNYYVTGGFILVSSNGGGNLYSANNDNAQGAYTPEAWQYVFDTATDDLTLQSIGMDCAKKWIRANPRRFVKLSLWKFVLFWHTDKEIAWWALQQTHEQHPEMPIPARWRLLGQSVSTGYYAACMLAAAGAVILRVRRLLRSSEWMLIPVICMYFTALHMVFESQGKYHFMLVAPLCILTALGCAAKDAIGPTTAPAEAKP